MKYFIITILSITSIANLFSQNSAFEKKCVYFSVGYGFNNSMTGVVKTSAAVGSVVSSLINNSTITNIKTSNAGPVIARLEYGIGNRFGLGLVVANNYITLSRDVNGMGQTGTDISNNPVYKEVNYTEKYSYNNLSIGLRPTFHFMKREKLDMNLGVGVGYSFINIKSVDISPNSTPFKLNINIPAYFSLTYGVRYYFTPSVGAYLEVGYDKSSMAQGGLVFKL